MPMLGQVDDREPAETQRDPGVLIYPFAGVIGTAVTNGARQVCYC